MCSLRIGVNLPKATRPVAFFFSPHNSFPLQHSGVTPHGTVVVQLFRNSPRSKKKKKKKSYMYILERSSSLTAAQKMTIKTGVSVAVFSARPDSEKTRRERCLTE